MIKYLVITDGGDGDISWELVSTAQQANTAIMESRDYGKSYEAVLEIDFENQTIKRTHGCQ